MPHPRLGWLLPCEKRPVDNFGPHGAGGTPASTIEADQEFRFTGEMAELVEGAPLLREYTS